MTSSPVLLGLELGVVPGQLLAVVAGDDDQGVRPALYLAQLRDELADVVGELRHRAEVALVRVVREALAVGSAQLAAVLVDLHEVDLQVAGTLAALGLRPRPGEGPAQHGPRPG